MGGTGSANPADMLRGHAAAAAAGSFTSFAYSDSAVRGDVKFTHPALDPAYGGIRVSDYPEPGKAVKNVVVLMDDTGSQIRAIRKARENLHQLLSLLHVHGWLGAYLNLQVAAVGDCYADDYWLQISQHEHDAETIDRWLNSIVLEGGGGGGNHESYGEAFWMLNNQNRFQCWQDGVKPMLFVLADEVLYPHVSAAALRLIYSRENHAPDDAWEHVTDSMKKRTLELGFELPAHDIPIEDVVAELRRNYDVTIMLMDESQYGKDAGNQKRWSDLFGQVQRVPDADEVSALIAAIVGSKHGVAADEITTALATMDVNDRSIAHIRESVRNYAGAGLQPYVAPNDKIARL